MKLRSSFPAQNQKELQKPRKARPATAVIIPALNEEKSIRLVLENLPIKKLAQIIVVDNGSTDKTGEVARSVHPKVTVISEARRGYGRACLTGIEKLKDEIDVVIFLDADFSDDPSEIQKLLKPVYLDQADFVIGSRAIRKKNRRALTPQQIFGNWLATKLIFLIWGERFTDLGPFRVIRRDALERLEMKDENYGWTVEMQIKAVQKNLRCLEVPVTYRCRVGKSKISGTISGSIKAGYKILYVIFRELMINRQ